MQHGMRPNKLSALSIAVNIDEVYALEQLYKDVSNSLHQVRRRRWRDGINQDAIVASCLTHVEPLQRSASERWHFALHNICRTLAEMNRA